MTYLGKRSDAALSHTDMLHALESAATAGKELHNALYVNRASVTLDRLTALAEALTQANIYAHALVNQTEDLMARCQQAIDNYVPQDYNEIGDHIP